MWVRRIIITRNVNKPTRVRVWWMQGHAMSTTVCTHTNTHTRTYVQHANFSGGSKRGRQERTPPGTNSFIFMQFSAKKLQNNRLADPPSPLGVGGLPLGNPGPTTEHTSFSCLHLFTKRVRWKKKKKKKRIEFLEMSVAAPAAASCVYE